MFDKRLLRAVPKTKTFVLKQVMSQWIALLMNIVFTIMICFLFTFLLEKRLEMKHLIYVGMIMIVILSIRAKALKKAILFSFEGANLVKKILRQRLFEKVLSLGNHYQEAVSTSELVQLSVEGINQLETYFALYLPQLFYSVLAPITLFIVISFFDIKSAFILFLCVPLIPLSIICVQKFAKKLLSKYWNSYTTLGDSFLENLQGLTTFKIYQSDGFKQRQMYQEAQNFRKVTMRVLIMQLNSISIMDIVAYGGAGLGSYMGISHYMNESISLFGALLIILLSFEFFIPLRQLGSFFHIAMNGMAASDKIFRLLDMPEREQGAEELSGENLDITFEQVSFSYEKERPILKDVSFHISKGQFVSLVGESGCGKSTVASLILGRNRQYQGRILLGGTDLKKIKEKSLMEHVTLVRHNSYLFKGTVEENLLMGNPNATQEEMTEALKKVNLWEFLKGQEGLSTKLAEKGSNFSGGQCQRLCIARALLHDTEIYIFDEAASNIDMESEEIIMDVIRQLAETKTVFLISHRLANVKKSHCIYVLKEGKIVEKGTHKELLEQQGAYKEMYMTQKNLENYGLEQEASA